MREQGPIMELVLNAQRRIRLLEQIDDSAIEEDQKKSSGKLNGRRNRKTSKDLSKKTDDTTAEQKTTEFDLIFGKTENIKTDTIERTVQLKVMKNSLEQILSFSGFDASDCPNCSRYC